MAKERQNKIISCWCPNCGIPKTATITLKAYMKNRKKVVFACHSCGFVADFVKHSDGKEEKKKDDDAEFSLSDLTKATKTIKTIRGLGSLIK